MLTIDKTTDSSKLPVMFVGFLVAFVVTLLIFNFSAIQEKLGVETRTSALVKLENVNNEIQQLKTANARLLKELENQSKIQLMTASIIKKLDQDNAKVLETMLVIENTKQIALAQVDSSDYIDGYFQESTTIYELPVEKPDVKKESIPDNTNTPDTAPTPVKPVKTKSTQSDSVAKTKTNERSRVQITALWNTYNSLHAG